MKKARNARKRKARRDKNALGAIAEDMDKKARYDMEKQARKDKQAARAMERKMEKLTIGKNDHEAAEATERLTKKEEKQIRVCFSPFVKSRD